MPRADCKSSQLGDRYSIDSHSVHCSDELDGKQFKFYFGHGLIIPGKYSIYSDRTQLTGDGVGLETAIGSDAAGGKFTVVVPRLVATKVC